MIETLRTWRLLRSLRRGARGSRDSHAGLQARLLRAAIRHAHERVPLYRRMWDEAGVDPGAVRGPEDLRRLPPLSAGAAREAIERGELVARGVDPSSLPAFPTSGSSGRPLWVARGPTEQRVWRASALRIWFEHGYRWSQITAQLDPHPGPPHPLQRIGVSRTAWVSTELDVEQQVELLRRSRADVVVGTPSALRRVARSVAAAGGEIARPRVVFAHGEVLDAGSSGLIERVLGTAPVGLYGLTELGHLAWQCERREGYHVSADTCLVELIRDGRPAGPGEVGAVIVTDLRGRTNPLVRYETGDLAVAGAGPCACGRTLPLLRSVEGRARDAVRLPDGRLVTTRVLVDHMSGVLPPDRYQLRQEAPALFRLHVDAPGWSDAESHVRALLGEVELRPGAGLPAAAGSRDKSQPLACALTRARLEAPA